MIFLFKKALPLACYPSKCSFRNRSLTLFTGLNVAKGTSTNTVTHSAMAPFHNPGSSCDLTVCDPLLFLAMKPVVGSTYFLKSKYRPL